MIDDANTHYIDGNKRLNNMHQGPFDIARQWRRGFCATLVALPAIIVPLWIMTCELGPTDRYIVPLCDHYILQSPASSEREFASLGPFQLEKVSKGADLLSWESYIPDYTVISTRPTSDALPWWDPSFKAPPFRISGLLPNVVRIGFDDQIIVGQTRSQFFSLDANSNDPDLSLYNSRQEYEAALARLGILNVRLQDPAELALQLPRNVIRPWAYQYMNNKWHHSDYWWCSLIEDIGFLSSFYIGLLLPRGRTNRGNVLSVTLLLCISVSIGCNVNVLANFSGDGPTEFAGSIVLPIFCIIATLWGRGIKTLTSCSVSTFRILRWRDGA